MHVTSKTVVDDFFTQKALFVAAISHCGLKVSDLVHIKRLL